MVVFFKPIQRFVQQVQQELPDHTLDKIQYAYNRIPSASSLGKAAQARLSCWEVEVGIRPPNLEPISEPDEADWDFIGDVEDAVREIPEGEARKAYRPLGLFPHLEELAAATCARAEREARDRPPPVPISQPDEVDWDHLSDVEDESDEANLSGDDGEGFEIVTVKEYGEIVKAEAAEKHEEVKRKASRTPQRIDSWAQGMQQRTKRAEQQGDDESPSSMEMIELDRRTSRRPPIPTAEMWNFDRRFRRRLKDRGGQKSRLYTPVSRVRFTEETYDLVRTLHNQQEDGED